MLNVAAGGQNKVIIFFVVEDEICLFISQLSWLVAESTRNVGLWLAVISYVCLFVVFLFHVCKYCYILFMFFLDTSCARENILIW